MSTTSPPTLAERQSGLTERLILDSAIDILESSSLRELTARGIAARANISERTMFRYFATRDALLDAVAAEVARLLAAPADPASVEDLLAMPDKLYRRFEARTALTRAALHTEISDRIRAGVARNRWIAVGKVLDAYAPRRPARERRIAAANIRFFLSASTWQYYRFRFGFSLEETIACARTAIEQALAALRKR
jgi:AcrR family transcriptional regulator